MADKRTAQEKKEEKKMSRREHLTRRVEGGPLAEKEKDRQDQKKSLGGWFRKSMEGSRRRAYNANLLSPHKRSTDKEKNNKEKGSGKERA